MKDAQDQEASRVDASEFLLAIESWRKCASRKPPSIVSYRGALVIGAPKDRATLEGERKHAEECERLRGEKAEAKGKVLELGGALALSLKAALVSSLPVHRILQQVMEEKGEHPLTPREWSELLAHLDSALLEALPSEPSLAKVNSKDPRANPEIWLSAVQVAELLEDAGEVGKGGSSLTPDAFRKRVKSGNRRKQEHDPYRIISESRDPRTGKYPMQIVAEVASHLAAGRGVELEKLKVAYRRLRRAKESELEGVTGRTSGRGPSLPL